MAFGKEVAGKLQCPVLQTALFTSSSSISLLSWTMLHPQSHPLEQDRQALCPHSVADSRKVCRGSEIWPRPQKDLVLELAFEQMHEQRNKKMNWVTVILLKGQAHNVTLLFKRY